jgi:hypothetical protein
MYVCLEASKLDIHATGVAASSLLHATVSGVTGVRRDWARQWVADLETEQTRSLLGVTTTPWLWLSQLRIGTTWVVLLVLGAPKRKKLTDKK